MKLYLDADSCPVVRQALAIAARRGVAAVVVCDNAHRIDCPGAELVMVDRGPDSADLALANLLQPGDAAVTQDFGLAALCLARGACALDQNGRQYTRDNIGPLLEQRAFAGKQRRAGRYGKGPARRTAAQDAAFCTALETLLEQLARPG